MGTRLTPMNILLDNVKVIQQRNNNMQTLILIGEVEDMVAGDYFGKPLIDQEQELFIDAFMDGFRLQSYHGDLIDEDKAKEIAKEAFERHYNKQEDDQEV